ncbi:MAG: FprA family A-type flavoprotein [Lysobacteraceae bacterium]|nr:MAG: FprA family A-type flavoprotein [Xanthomonadaceae bacterium]
MSTILFDNGAHRCIVFNDLVQGDDGVQANQFLIQDGNEAALLDPGGDLLYTPLWLAVTPFVRLQQIVWILASHQDPDIIGAVDRWLTNTPARVACSRLWGRFVPHSVSHYQAGKIGGDRYLLLPDEGGVVPLGATALRALPAHFLHSVGNFSFFDPVSRILFSGDVGSSMITHGTDFAPVEEFASHVGAMEGFHRRYMGSNRVTRIWAAMVRRLDPEMIVPQHGLPMDRRTIPAFLAWLEELRCGIDLIEQGGHVAA